MKTNSQWPIPCGTRVSHPRCGIGTVLEWKEDSYCTKNWREEEHAVRVRLDNPPDGWAKTVQLDADNLTLLGKGE